MLGEQDHERRLTQGLEQRRGAGQVREQDRAERARDLGLVDRVVDPAEEAHDVAFGHRDDLVRDSTVRSAMEGIEGIGLRGPREAEGAAGLLVVPVRQQLDVVFVGEREITGVVARHFLRGRTRHVMAIHVERHPGAPLSFGSTRRAGVATDHTIAPLTITTRPLCHSQRGSAIPRRAFGRSVVIALADVVVVSGSNPG